MDRDSILESFHTISQIQDFGECIQILESVDWNLESALNSIEQSHFSVPEAESSASLEYQVLHEQTQTEPRNIFFNVTVRGKVIKVDISEDNTVSDLEDLVAQKINEPQSKFKINGLKLPYSASTQLKHLQLPFENNISANQIENPYSNCASSSRNSSVNNKSHKLSISVFYNEEFQQVLELAFDGKDTVGKVKSHLATLLGCPINQQQWQGWPINVNDEKSLKASGISEHQLLKVYINRDPKAFKSTIRSRVECNRMPVEASLNNSRIDEMDNDDEDDYYEYPEDMELMEQESEWTSKRSIALMNQDAHNDAMVATLYFSNEFSTRYCSNDNIAKPPFFIGTLEEALSNTLYLPPKQRKPLFIYLHHGESIQANIFCTQVLCYNEIITFFNQSDYMIWPWDITYTENKTQLMNWLTRNFGQAIVAHFRIILKDHFPILAALGKSQGNVEILEILDGSKSKDEIYFRLLDINSQFYDKQKVDIIAWEEQELRKQVMMEQDKAYQESLSKDQIKEKERDDKKRKIEEAERNKDLQKRRDEEDKNNRIHIALSKVPPEPEDSPEVITIRLRLPPNGEAPSKNAPTRRFLDSHTVDHLVAYIESMGYLRTEFKLLMTFPRTDLTQINDPNTTLKSLRIPKRETLTLERL